MLYTFMHQTDMGGGMRRVYVASNEPRVGKTVFAAALASLAGEGAAYRAVAQVGDNEAFADSPLIPGIAAADGIASHIDSGLDAAREGLRSLEADHSLVVVDGLGLDAGRVDARLAEALDAETTLIVWYDEHAYGEGDISGIRAAAEPYGDRLARIVINAVPDLRMHFVETEILPALAAAGLPPAMAVRQNRLLSAPTLREIVAHLDADVVAHPEGLDALVSCIMVGALALDGGIYYYGQAEQKIVITRWDRPDLQMPALATGCQGLILTGGQGPIPYVQNRVDELRVPVAVVPGDTVTTAGRLSDGLLSGRGRMHTDKVSAMADQLRDSPVATEIGAGAA